MVEGDYLEDLSVDGCTSRMGGMDCFDLAQDREGQVAGSCECGDDTLGFTKCGEFLY